MIFTHHARKRMERRKIVPEMAYQTLTNPSIILPQFEDGTQEFRRKIARTVPGSKGTLNEPLNTT